MKARLLVRLRPGETRAFELHGDAVLGRDEGLPVSLPFEEVSRQHARISWDGKSHWLEDLASTNGTFLNGRRLQKEREKLRHLSVVTLGSSTDLVFVVGAEQTETLRRTVIQHAFLVREGAESVPHEIPLGEFTLGRSGSCSIVSDSPEVSKLHARITRSADKLGVKDLGSENGTWVNGVRVSEAPLVDGDLVAFAEERYRVSLALAEVTSASVAGLRAEDVAVSAAEPDQPAAPRFSADWKQRVEGLEREQPSGPVGDVTNRSARLAADWLDPKASPASLAAGRIEVRLSAPGVELVAKGAGNYGLGSALGAALRVEAASVVGAHARVIVSDLLGSVFVQPEDGPTQRNGAAVERTQPLEDADVLRLGELELLVEIRRVD